MPGRGRVRVRAELTGRAREILVLISEQLPSPVVAQRLGISEVTVRRQVSSAMHELDVPNPASALQLRRDRRAGRVVGMRVDVARRHPPMLCTVALGAS
jgi:DNA-binding NarL/FixJ family response regulator